MLLLVALIRLIRTGEEPTVDTVAIRRGGQEMISYNICRSYNKLSIVTLGSIMDSQLAENIASFSLQDGATK